jgi:transcriptional regulator with XRE-family HTH domain
LYITDFNKIRQLMAKENLTQDAFAEKISISRSMIGAILVGTKQPSNDLLKRMAVYFRITADELMVEVNPPQSGAGDADAV